MTDKSELQARRRLHHMRQDYAERCAVVNRIEDPEERGRYEPDLATRWETIQGLAAEVGPEL